MNIEIQEKIIIASHNTKLGHENCSQDNCLALINSLITFWKNEITENNKKYTKIVIQAIENYKNFTELLNNPLLSQEIKEEIKERQKSCLITIGKCVISQLKIEKEG